MPMVVVVNLIPGLTVTLPTRVQAVINNEADRIAEGAKTMMNTYYPPASAPGAPPAIRTGEYKDGIAAQHDTAPLQATVTFPSPGIFLEYGTRKMSPRPHVLPAIEISKPAFEAEVATVVVP